MERLTKKHYGGNGYYMACSEHCNKECFDCKEIDKIIDRLGTYEDTGLEPDVCSNYRKFEDEAISKGVTFKRIVELMNAEHDGRLVVLPCKVVCGTTIWWADSNFRTDPIKCEVSSFGIYTGPDGDLQVWINCYVYGSTPMSQSFRMSSIGKTVFLTLEEAEAALKGGEC